MSPNETKIQTRRFFLPQDLNKNGSLFGGVLMAEMDKIAAMAAELYAGTEVVTACVDELVFSKPININDHIILKAMINYVGTTSMEVGVRVEAQDPKTKTISFYCKAYFTFVALKKNKPFKLNKLRPQTDLEKQRYETAKQRVAERKKRRK